MLSHPIKWEGMFSHSFNCERKMLFYPSTCGRNALSSQHLREGMLSHPPTYVWGNALSSLQPWERNALSSLRLWEGMLSHPSACGREMLSHPIKWEGMFSHPFNCERKMLFHLSTCGREYSLIPLTVGGNASHPSNCRGKWSLVPPPMWGNAVSSLHLRERMLSYPSSYGR